jgi:glycosyltransferase involved in cell wall biosynthesis
MEPRKNHFRLIQAFHLLKQEDPTIEHQLILAGGKGWKFEPIFELIAALGLSQQVRWLGYVPFDHIPALLNGADVFVYPSLYEGFGLPPLEAMSCGAPVVASNTTSLPEVVGDGGLLVDPTNLEEIAGAMHRLMTDRALNADLRRRALARARMFTWENTARLTFAAYAEVFQRTEAKPPRESGRKMQPTKIREHLRNWIVSRVMMANGL